MSDDPSQFHIRTRGFEVSARGRLGIFAALVLLLGVPSVVAIWAPEALSGLLNLLTGR